MPAWNDPDLDPCPQGHNGNHSKEWIEGGRCTLCGAPSIAEVEVMEKKETTSLRFRMQGAYRPTDTMPLSRGGREHVMGMACWCKPFMKFSPATLSMMVMHRDPDRGVKGEQ